MSNEHIGRLEAVGWGKETTSGTEAAATVWFPKMTGKLRPAVSKAVNDSAYGNIDEISDVQTVMNMSELTMEGKASDDEMGHLLLAALGQVTQVQCATLSSISGGTPARGDSVSSATGSYTGTIKKIITIGSTDYYFISEDTGTLSNQTDLTDGTWTASVDFSTYSGSTNS